ncbi:hypothetical protein Tco_0049181, partial [Tanacetum coccineum]
MSSLTSLEAASQSPEQAPPLPDYVPGPERPPSPNCVPGPEYPEYVAPSDDEVPVKDQPLPADASPTALSYGYVADSDPEEDSEEDPARVDYEEKEEEPSEDDDDEEEEALEDDEEEEEHPAPADSTPPRLPYIRVPFAQTGLHRARKTVRPHTPPSPSVEARLTRSMAAPALPLPPPSPLSPWSSPLSQIPSPPLHVPSPPLLVLSPPLPLPSPPTSPTYDRAPLGYKAAMIRLRVASPSTYHPLLPSETPSPPIFEVEESSSAAARHTGHTLAHRIDYRFIDTVDASIRASDIRAMIFV